MQPKVLDLMLKGGPQALLLPPAGTPVQNSTADLFGIMNVLDPGTYPDEDAFLERFGRGMPTPEQVADLQVRVFLRLPSFRRSVRPCSL